MFSWWTLCSSMECLFKPLFSLNRRQVNVFFCAVEKMIKIISLFIMSSVFSECKEAKKEETPFAALTHVWCGRLGMKRCQIEWMSFRREDSYDDKWSRKRIKKFIWDMIWRSDKIVKFTLKIEIDRLRLDLIDYSKE